MIEFPSGKFPSACPVICPEIDYASLPEKASLEKPKIVPTLRSYYMLDALA
jgi:hypothetical protein